MPLSKNTLRFWNIPKYKKLDVEHVRDLSSFLLTLTERVELLIEIKKSPDPDDDKFLSTAVNGKADLLISRCREILKMATVVVLGLFAPSFDFSIHTIFV